MARKGTEWRPLSLAQHFDAPEGHVGHFGWICGYSADAAFLDDAAERFTRLTRAQRAFQGRIALAVMLDPGNPAITLLEAPGVAHLPILDFAGKPFRLLHAKIALLGFRHLERSDSWSLRLIVSTGNWTRQTLEESLDLAWRIDLASDSLEASDEGQVPQVCSDIKAAHGLLKWLAELFDTRLLAATPPGRFDETANAREQVDGWVRRCTERAKGQTRLFDSRAASLLDQLPDRIRACSSAVARNYLAMGSGFYESAGAQNPQAKVPPSIVDRLREGGLLTKGAEVDLFVNSQACQAIAASVEALNKQGLKIRPAAQPDFMGRPDRPRSLHAKFLFGASYRDNSNACNHAWGYLGSGNLTTPGFAAAMSERGGNLEAGVVFPAENLRWYQEKGLNPQQLVTNLLPIQWDDELREPAALQAGADLEERECSFPAAPVAWLGWWEQGGSSELRAPEDIPADLFLLDPAGEACLKSATGFQWPGSQPRQVRCRWGAHGEHAADLPVVDGLGRIAAAKLPAIGLDEVGWQLADFPFPPDDDLEDPDEGNGEDGDMDTVGKAARSVGLAASYPVRQMMELIENIAARQTSLGEADWPLWCNRLEQTLGQARDCAAVEHFRKLGLNPLSPLRHEAFRPAFAETGDSVAGQLYEGCLARMEQIWAVAQLKAMGDQR